MKLTRGGADHLSTQLFTNSCNVFQFIGFKISAKAKHILTICNMKLLKSVKFHGETFLKFSSILIIPILNKVS